MNRRAGFGEAYEPTRYEHLANVISHGVAVVPSFYAMRWMMAASYRDLQFRVSFIYGFFTTVLNASFLRIYCQKVISESNHLSRRGNHFGNIWTHEIFRKLRYYLHIVDRAAIYFFIAASYTPWLTLRHCAYPGLNIKWIVWLLACIGILYQYTFHEKYKTIETLLYIVMACGPSVAIFTMNDRSGLGFMGVGGVVYLFGVIFFKLDGIVPFAHAIWHVHVLIGAALHLYAVYNTLLGPDRMNPFPDISKVHAEF
ncbi:unnamed protein product [Anisakis simplex]|uniref:Monocyte to macrophage differentiation factor 2 n=1 Tax=Anisakis simplex TaxID=6269 RepID=A0A0M3JVH4_ANISI|nr:unnamed protein product [Anisakis simplex]